MGPPETVGTGGARGLVVTQLWMSCQCGPPCRGPPVHLRPATPRSRRSGLARPRDSRAPPAAVPLTGHDCDCRDPRAHLRGPHLRVPDERPRLRAADRAAGGRGLRRRAARTSRPTSSSSTPARCGRTPTTSSTATSATSRRSRPPSPGMQIAVGGCLAQKDRSTITEKAPWVDVVFGTHNIGSLPVLLERARVAGGGAGRDPRVARGLPLDAADQARVGVRRLGVDLGRVQQHLHVLHRPGAARQGEGPPPRRDPRRDRGAGRRGRHRDHPAGPERQRLRRRVRRPPGVLQAAARLRRRSRAWSGSGSPRRTRPSSPTTSSRRWPRRPT